MKKLLAIVLVLMLCLTVVGCSNNNNNDDSSENNNDVSSNNNDSSNNDDSSENEQESEPITISFWNGWTGPDGEVLAEYVDMFNENNPYDITIEMDINAEFLTKIAATFAGGKAPDMILAASSFKDQYTNHLIPLNEMFDETSLDNEDFINSYMQTCTLNDKLYVLPFQVTGRYMYWNKDLFEEAGLDPEASPSSYEEWAEWASMITNEDANVYGSGVPYNSVFNTVHILQRMGGLFVDKNDNGELTPRFEGNEGYADFLNWLNDMIKKGDNPLETDTDSMMKAGQIGIALSGAYLSPGLDEAGINYGVTQLPYGDVGPQAPASVSGFAVTTSASDEAKIAAYRFMEWWFEGYEDTETTGALAWSLTCGFPSHYYPAINDERYQSSEKMSKMTNTDKDAVTLFLSDEEFTKTFELCMEVINPMVEKVVVNDEDVQEALAEAQKDAEALIE